MLNNAKAKVIKELHEKKGRGAHNMFLVEGRKSVAELLDSDFKIDSLFITQYFYTTYKDTIEKKKCEYTVVEPLEIENLSTFEKFEKNDTALAVVHQKEVEDFRITSNDIVLALDSIQDPGNLGTIIRTADWYGVKKIIASQNTTDVYSPKVIAASMGSFFRISFVYTDLQEILSSIKVPVFGTFLEGENVHEATFPTGGIIVMGSESHGISDNLLPFITRKITIPKIGKAESLNVAIATAVVLDNWKRD